MLQLEESLVAAPVFPKRSFTQHHLEEGRKTYSNQTPAQGMADHGSIRDNGSTELLPTFEDVAIIVDPHVSDIQSLKQFQDYANVAFKKTYSSQTLKEEQSSNK